MKSAQAAKKNGKKLKSHADKDAPPMIAKPSISSEAARGAGAIFFSAIACFLLLAEAGSGGEIGASVYAGLYALLGVGYSLLPLSLILLAVLTVRSFEKRFGWIQILGMTIFLLSTLGLVNIALPGRGGIAGELITRPLIAGLDIAATVIFLTAFAIASLIVSFDLNLGALARSFAGLFHRRTEFEDESEALITGMQPDELDDMPEETIVEPEPMPLPEKTEKAPVVKSFAKPDAEPAEGFPIFAVSGHSYTPPPISILSKNRGKPEVGDIKANMNIIKRTLQNFGIQVEMDEASIGPSVTRYAIKPAEGVRLSKIVALQSNLELALAASPVRIEAPIPGKSLVGIEVPNIARTTLGLAPLLSDAEYAQSNRPLMIALGRSITGQAHFADLARMPHLLVAGTTGSGKSVTIHDFVVSLLYRCGPDRLRFIMIDPKRVELTLYNNIPHLLTPVITDAKKAILALKWLAKEMERRYNILETERVRDIASYHENVVAPSLKKNDPDKQVEAMPYIVLIIDELADIMQTYPRELEAGIVRLAQMSRAVGIHLVLSTQRPSVKVITGLIKANIPARVALQVASQIDSRTILDQGGAEKLLGSGDMLFLSGDMSKPRRIQAPYISESEVKQVVSFIIKHSDEMLGDEIDFDAAAKGAGSGMDAIFSSMGDGAGDEDDDELYPDAKRTVIEAGKASTSYLQRKLGVGYARAARLMDLLEERGVIGPADGAKPREIIGAGNADELAKEPEGEEVYDA